MAEEVLGGVAAPAFEQAAEQRAQFDDGAVEAMQRAQGPHAAETGADGLAPPRERARVDSGTPRISAITVAGSGVATSPTRSNRPRVAASSASRSASPTTRGS